MAKCSLLISTYNWPAALKLCLTSVLEQSLLPNEIIICDDGSKDDTKDIINEFKKISVIPIVHVWQPDDGFQLARIRNKGFAIAKFEYIIQVDGDLLFHKDFIKDHLNFSKEGFFTTGSRVLISEKLTAQMLNSNIVNVHRLSFKNKNFLNRLHLPFLHNIISRKYKIIGKYEYYVKGCNMAFWKSDLIKVNGYNEDFTGWGREDSEIAIRLINNSINKRFIKFGAICYHLYHKEASREMEQTNVSMMQKAIHDKIRRATNGLDKYL